MKKPGLLLFIIIFLLVVAGVLITMGTSHPPPSTKGILVKGPENDAGFREGRDTITNVCG